MSANFTLAPEQRALRERFADFGADERFNRDMAARSRDGVFDPALWELAGAEKLPGLPVPRELGGLGHPALETMLALEGFAYGCEDGGLGFAIGAQLFATTIPVWLYGSDEQKRRFLPGLCDGSRVASNAMTEPSGGSAAFQMASRAEPEGDGYRLSGYKSYCAGAPISDLCLAYVLTDPNKGFFGGVSVFLLERAKHGYQVEKEVDKYGLRTCMTGTIRLDGVAAGAGDLLGKPGAGGAIFNRSMEWERIGMCALHVGTMTRLLERAVAFAKKRKPGGVAISQHQAVSHALADIDTRLAACRLLVYAAADSLDRGEDTNRMASRTKLFVSECFRDTATKLMQIHASEGYAADSEIGRALQDAVGSTLYSGTSEIQRNIIARWLGC